VIQEFLFDGIAAWSGHALPPTGKCPCIAGFREMLHTADYFRYLRSGLMASSYTTVVDRLFGQCIGVGLPALVCLPGVVLVVAAP